METKYSIADARSNMAKMIECVERGAEIELTKRGQSVAVVISIDAYQKMKGIRKSFWKELQKFNERRDATKIHFPNGVFNDLRDKSSGRDFSW